MRKGALVVVLLLAAGYEKAAAHSLITYTVAPDSMSRAIDIQRPQVSQVIYREVRPGSTQTWFRFRGKRGERISFNLGVPVLDRLQGFRQSVALLGPGLPAPPRGLPLEVPEGAGAALFRPLEDTEPFHEEFTGTDSWILVREVVQLPADGEYYLVAFAGERSQETGKVWLAIGTKERFTLREIFSFGKIRRAVREFHELR